MMDLQYPSDRHRQQDGEADHEPLIARQEPVIIINGIQGVTCGLASVWKRHWPAIIAWILMGWANHPARAEVDAASVQRSIDRGVAYLRNTQNDAGGWEEYSGQSCGKTALCVLALLNCGVDHQDPAMVRAMKYLRKHQPQRTYSVALQTLVYCKWGAAGDLPRIRRNVRWLEDLQLESAAPGQNGSWPYGKELGSGDPSNTQFAILALGAAMDRGVDVSPDTFEAALKYWSARQKRTGGWSYRDQPTGSMTCAGIASVIIARGHLDGQTSKIDGAKIRCCGQNDNDQADPVEAGLAWLGKNFTVRTNPNNAKQTYFYFLYALERVGRLSGRRFISGHDWYREGAEQILSVQDELQGNWPSGSPLEPPDVATAFALLFLSKGKRQVVVGRLRHVAANESTDRDWQHHPDGLRQMVRQVERDWGRDLTWQTVESQSATLTDLLQTPVLVISGTQSLAFSESLVELLRQYIEQGGTIFFEADGGDGCGSAESFVSDVQRLSNRLVGDAKLERLPPDHPIWFAERKVDAEAMGKDFWMYGVQACCRTSIFFSPRSLSCRWELGEAIFRRREMNPAAKKQIETALGIGSNLIAYATGRELKDKLESHFLIDGAPVPRPTRGTTQLAMLSLDAGGAEARRALTNAAAMISQSVPLPISAATEPVALEAESLQDVSVLWVHGSTAFSLSADQTGQLQQFLDDGGILIATSICGRDEFSRSFRELMTKVLPDHPLTPIKAGHPLIRVPGGFDLSRVTSRTPTNRRDSVTKRVGIPSIEVATQDETAAVFFCPLDLSCALESPNSIQCPGYSTEDAAKIITNILLLATQQ